MTRARQTVLDELGASAGQLDPAPVSVVIFGSAARGEADRESDLDVVIVRPSRTDEEDRRWRDGIDGWRLDAGRLTGNPIEVLEVSEGEAARLLSSGSPLWADIEREGIVVFGVALAALKARRSA